MATATKERKKSGTGSVLSVAGLKAALAAVAPAVRGGPKPILQNVLLAGGKVAATDLELRIDHAIDYHGIPVVLPHHRLQAILREAVGDEVTLRVDGSLCVVEVGRGEWKLPTEDVSEYPTWEPAGTKLVCRMPSDQLKRAIASVVHAEDQDSVRYALGGVCIEVSREDEKVHFVATDGRRLSVASAGLGHSQDPDSGISLIPDAAAQAVKTLCPKNGQVEIVTNGREVIFTLEDATIIARQIEGRFPKWRDVFEGNGGHTTHRVNLKSFHSVTRAARIVTSEQSKGVTYNFADSSLTLTAKSSEAGESKVKCDVDEYGRDASVQLDPTFVSHLCKAWESLEGEPTVSVSLNGPGDAVVFSYGEDGEYRSVIMPLAKE